MINAKKCCIRYSTQRVINIFPNLKEIKGDPQGPETVLLQKADEKVAHRILA